MGDERLQQDGINDALDYWEGMDDDARQWVNNLAGEVELRDARAEIERLSWRKIRTSQSVEIRELRAELAVERAKVERVEAIAREAIDNIVSGHSTHWDSTMQYGAGCEQCKHERTVRDRLRSALTGEESDDV